MHMAATWRFRAASTAVCAVAVLGLGACGTPAPSLNGAGGAGSGSVVGGQETTLTPREGQYLVTDLDATPTPGQFPVGAENDALARAWLNNSGQLSISANGGCNQIRSQLRGNQISHFAMTEVGCAPEKMARDDEFVADLSVEPIILSVRNENQFAIGNLLFTYWLPLNEQPPIAEYYGLPQDGQYEGWLESRTDTVVSNTRIAAARVTDNGTAIHFDAGCNQIRVPVNEDRTLGPAASTRMACPEDSNEHILMQQLADGEFNIESESRFTIGDIVFSRTTVR